MYIKSATYKEKGEIEKLRRIGRICTEIKCYQSRLSRFISQHGLYYNFLERAFEVDDDKIYERSQLLKTKWMSFSNKNKKRVQHGKPYKEISVKKEHKITWVDKLRDALLSPSTLLPEQRLRPFI